MNLTGVDNPSFMLTQNLPFKEALFTSACQKDNREIMYWLHTMANLAITNNPPRDPDYLVYEFFTEFGTLFRVC